MNKIPYINPQGFNYIEQESAERMPTIQAYMNTIYQQREALVYHEKIIKSMSYHMKVQDRIIAGLGVTASILIGALIWCLS